MRPLLQIAFSCNETGYERDETTVQPEPSSRELDPIRAELEYQQQQASVFRVKVLWENTITSGSYEQQMFTSYR